MTTKPWAIMPYIDCYEYTEPAVQDVLAQAGKVFQAEKLQLLLIDNGSKDPIQDHEWPERVHTWRHAPPLPSLAATWNRALDFVWSTGTDRALVVNNDVRLDPETYRHLSLMMDTDAALFVTAVGVNEETWKNRRGVDVTSRGGPDFSCYLISKACHELYRFDENFAPAYFEDNDYHRRLELDGYGDRIFSIDVPFLHYGSVTINRTEETKRAFSPKFEKCRDYYVRKWGGLPGEEKFEVAFNGEA